MFRVDVENILRRCSNVYGVRTRYPNPLNNVEFEPEDFNSNEFRMYSYKIKKCPLNRSHDWTICPYAHQGERARRRDPRRVLYVALSCPDYKATGGACPRGELCEYAHGVFEYWLHPTKYRTRVCNAGSKCARPVCFFAHNSNELRIAPTNHLPKWLRLALRAELEARVMNLPTTDVVNSNNNARQGLGLTGRPQTSNTPNPALPGLPCSTTSNSANDRSQELRFDQFLESLRMLRISEYYNSQVVQNNNARTYVDFDVPNFDWVSDMLAG